MKRKLSKRPEKAISVSRVVPGSDFWKVLNIRFVSLCLGLEQINFRSLPGIPGKVVHFCGPEPELVGISVLAEVAVLNRIYLIGLQQLVHVGSSTGPGYSLLWFDLQEKMCFF